MLIAYVTTTEHGIYSSAAMNIPFTNISALGFKIHPVVLSENSVDCCLNFIPFSSF